jgi:phenylalanyl-tRNA synthetase alpha chain
MDFTTTQRERLTDLGVPAETVAEALRALAAKAADDVAVRNETYRALELAAVRGNKDGLSRLVENDLVTPSLNTIAALAGWLRREGYTRVETPVIIPFTMLDKMTITEDEPLRDQVFRVDKNKCLRPMLAPGLYVLMRELHRILGTPIRIFEAGSCFRRETEGSKHLTEFTMLNMVEFAGVEDGGQRAKLEGLAAGAMAAVGIDDYTLETEASVVYGETIDIVSKDGLELASASYGPHSLDPNWGVFDTWVGIGFGIERITLAKSGGENIKRYSKSINYLGGMSLRV